MTAMISRRILIVWIVSLALGCDNVSWGGIDVSLQRPASDTAGQVPEPSPDTEEGSAHPDIGPILYAGSRMGDSALVHTVAIVQDGAFRALPSGGEGALLTDEILRERLLLGSRLTLFGEGVRVGTLTVTGPGTAGPEFCPPRPRAVGRIELVPEAMDAQRFLALEETVAGGLAFLPFLPLRDQYAQRVASTDMAMEVIPQVGAAWPPSLLDIRRDLQVFQLRGEEGPAVAATFLHQDRFTLNPAPHDAYSLLVLGEPMGGGYTRTFVRYQLVGASGKGAARFFSHLDWDVDGQDEILLEILGDGTRWWAGLERDAEGWNVAFEDACRPQPPESPADPGRS